MGNFFDYEPPETSNVLVVGLKGSGKSSLMLAVERLEMNEQQVKLSQVRWIYVLPLFLYCNCCIQDQQAAAAGQPQPAARYFDYRVTAELNICFTDLSGDPTVRSDWKSYAEAVRLLCN